MGLSITGSVIITGRFTATTSTLPGAPTGVSVLYSSTSGYALLSWSAPASSGTFPVTGYQINSVPEITSPISYPISVANNITSWYVTGLSATTYYSFSVAAITPSGIGAASTTTTLFYSPQNASSATDAVYTTPGSYTWVAPAGVGTVSIVAVGGGGSTNNQAAG